MASSPVRLSASRCPRTEAPSRLSFRRGRSRATFWSSVSRAASQTTRLGSCSSPRARSWPGSKPLACRAAAARGRPGGCRSQARSAVCCAAPRRQRRGRSSRRDSWRTRFVTPSRNSWSPARAVGRMRRWWDAPERPSSRSHLRAASRRRSRALRWSTTPSIPSRSTRTLTAPVVRTLLFPPSAPYVQPSPHRPQSPPPTVPTAQSPTAPGRLTPACLGRAANGRRPRADQRLGRRGKGEGAGPQVGGGRARDASGRPRAGPRRAPRQGLRRPDLHAAQVEQRHLTSISHCGRGTWRRSRTPLNERPRETARLRLVRWRHGPSTDMGCGRLAVGRASFLKFLYETAPGKRILWGKSQPRSCNLRGSANYPTVRIVGILG